MSVSIQFGLEAMMDCNSGLTDLASAVQIESLAWLADFP